jgi:hypothetical protein
MKMKGIRLNLCLLVVSGLAFSACHKKDAASELEKAAVAMAQAEAAPPAAPDATPSPAPASAPPAQQVREALADYKAGKMEDAVTRLQVLRAQPALSPQQRMVLQDSIAAVMAEIYSLAEKGDSRAIAAVAQYEKMQTTR